MLGLMFARDGDSGVGLVWLVWCSSLAGVHALHWCVGLLPMSHE